MERYAFPILGELRVNRIQREDMLRVLTPIWARNPETAPRVRQRTRSVLRWAHAHGYVQENMAREALEGALPSLTARQTHFRAAAGPSRDRSTGSRPRPVARRGGSAAPEDPSVHHRDWALGKSGLAFAHRAGVASLVKLESDPDRIWWITPPGPSSETAPRGLSCVRDSRAFGSLH